MRWSINPLNPLTDMLKAVRFRSAEMAELQLQKAAELISEVNPSSMASVDLHSHSACLKPPRQKFTPPRHSPETFSNPMQENNLTHHRKQGPNISINGHNGRPIYHRQLEPREPVELNSAPTYALAKSVALICITRGTGEGYLLRQGPATMCRRDKRYFYLFIFFCRLPPQMKPFPVLGRASLSEELRI